ncbi:MAG: sulfatase, partial [Roseobacter sp.]
KDRDHPNLPFYLDNWDKAFFLRDVEKPSRVTQRRKSDYGEKLGAWVWEQEKILHPDVFTGQMAKWWLERYTGDGPFFLQVGLPGPHPPYDPTQEYLDKYADRDLPDVIPPDPQAQPEALRGLRDFMLGEDADGVVHLPAPTAEQSRRQRAHYYANVTMIDTQVGEIIDALEARGDLENTIIVFTSDHGDALGDHGHSQKWNMYQSTVHVPAIVAGPGIPAGQKIHDNVALFDLGPTILEWANVPVPGWMEATSLHPYFTKGPTPKRTKVFAEHSNDALLTGTRLMTMLLDDQMKLVHFVDSPAGQLFDLAADPTEQVNLWDDPNYAETRTRMLDDIFKWRSESGLKTQGFVEACVRGAHAMMSPPTHVARGQHRDANR